MSLTRNLYPLAAGLFAGLTLGADTSLCGQCSVLGEVAEAHWYRLKAPETFTAYTIATVVNTVLHSTTTTTILNETP